MYQSTNVPIDKITNANDLVTRLATIGDVIIYLLIGAAIVFIVWNVVNLLIKGDNSEEKTKNTKNIGWGIVGLAIILSIWGLVNVLLNTFNTDTTIDTNRIPSADFMKNSSGGNYWQTVDKGGDIKK